MTGSVQSRWRAGAYVGAALAAILAWASPSLAQTGSIRGVVNDSLTGTAVPGAMVELEGTDRGVLTGDNGAFLFRDLAPGSYTVTVTVVDLATQRTAKRTTKLVVLSPKDLKPQ